MSLKLIDLSINLFNIWIQYFYFRFRKSITGCSKMFLAVSAACDKWKENMHEHISGRREQPRWCCHGYYRKTWYCESMKWPSEQPCLLTQSLTGLYICVHSFRAFILCCIQTVYKPNWSIANQILTGKEVNF